MNKILIIEDEDNIRKIIAYDLKRDYELSEAADGETALNMALNEHFDVLIIDWMIPRLSGLELVSRLRKKNIDSIMIMLTAKDDEADILQAFEEGVDDYITKPFSPRELVARVNAHIKRLPKADHEKLTFGNVSIHLKKREVLISNEAVGCTKKEFDLLVYLMMNHEIVLSRDQICSEIWGFEYDGDTRIVDVHIFKLRSKLAKSNVTIQSNRGVGYCMELKDGQA